MVGETAQNSEPVPVSKCKGMLFVCGWGWGVLVLGGSHYLHEECGTIPGSGVLLSWFISGVKPVERKNIPEI